ncbi:hypothetical protein LSAT2_009483 [Lamellibrachia satsuma]|nr:hypothetical protein LSAT2_009483 [Lamellibrachia satsuma]
MHLTDGHSTSADRRCVYMFNVPESDCDQTPGPSVDDQLLKSHVIALQAQLKLMASDMRVMQEHIEKLDSDNKQLVNDVNNLKKERPNSNTGILERKDVTGEGDAAQPSLAAVQQRGR